MADKTNKALMNTLCTVQIMPALEFMYFDLTMEEYRKVKRYQLTWFFVGLVFIVLSVVSFLYLILAWSILLLVIFVEFWLYRGFVSRLFSQLILE